MVIKFRHDRAADAGQTEVQIAKRTAAVQERRIEIRSPDTLSLISATNSALRLAASSIICRFRGGAAAGFRWWNTPSLETAVERKEEKRVIARLFQRWLIVF